MGRVVVASHSQHYSYLQAQMRELEARIQEQERKRSGACLATSPSPRPSPLASPSGGPCAAPAVAPGGGLALLQPPPRDSWDELVSALPLHADGIPSDREALDAAFLSEAGEGAELAGIAPGLFMDSGWGGGAYNQSYYQ